MVNRFASQSRSRVSHLKRQLQSLHQESKTCAEYLKTAKGWANQLTVIGRPTDDEDLISYIICVLNLTFNAFVTSYGLATRDNPLSLLQIFRMNSSITRHCSINSRPQLWMHLILHFSCSARTMVALLDHHILPGKGKARTILLVSSLHGLDS